MSLFLSRQGEQSPTKTAVWRDFQAWGIIAQVRNNVLTVEILLPTTMLIVIENTARP
jgi:hypothetical protein